MRFSPTWLLKLGTSFPVAGLVVHALSAETASKSPHIIRRAEQLLDRISEEIIKFPVPQFAPDSLP